MFVPSALTLAVSDRLHMLQRTLDCNHLRSDQVLGIYLEAVCSHLRDKQGNALQESACLGALTLEIYFVQGSLAMDLQPQHSAPPHQMAALSHATAAHASRPQSSPAASQEAILPLSVPPVLAAIWAPSPVSGAASWNEPRPLTSNQQSPPQRGLPVSAPRQLSAC